MNPSKHKKPKINFHKLHKSSHSDPPKRYVIILLKTLRTTGTIFTILIGTLAMLIFRSISWMLKTWNNLTMEELIYHLKSPMQGTNEGMITEYIISCLIITFITLIVLIAIFIFVRKKHLAHNITILTTLFISFLTIILSVHYVWNTLDISAYSSNQSTYSTFIDDNYVNPQDVELKFPETKRNLVYIYLESMENTYADKQIGGGFKTNTIPELTQLSIENENFSGDKQILNGGTSLTGTGWTIAAMFGQTSGLPLLIPIEQNAMNTQNHFFPGLTSLGDILDAAGYQQGLLIGSEAEFGGRKLYFTEHGNYKIWDYNYFIENGSLPEDYRVWWGFEDKHLFEFAKEKLTEMNSSDKPFNLTLLTVDTHFEDGYFCSDCKDEFDDQYSNVMACSSRKVANFVQWIKQQDFYENTTIVISGDHPTMDSDFCNSVADDYERKVYTTYINSTVEPENNSFREYSTLDAFPTTLAGMGVEIEGNRLGLGTNLFSNTQTLIERFGIDTVNSELSKKSFLIEKLTSDIVTDNNLHITDEQLEPEAEPITADITTTPYDYHTGKFKVIVQNLKSDHDIQNVRCAVWSSEDQSDLKWYEAILQDDDSFIANIMASDFNYIESEYTIHVYVVDSSGNSELIGSVIGEIT